MSEPERFPIADISDLQAGTAAEHIVCADLLLDGWRAFMSDQNCPYDIAVEVDRRPIRVQVKSTRTFKATPQRVNWTPTYLWQVNRPARRGDRQRYVEGDFDVVALVALDIRRIAYIAFASAPGTMLIAPPGESGSRQFNDYPFEKALAEVSS